jgi:hypothetical protein
MSQPGISKIFQHASQQLLLVFDDYFLCTLMQRACQRERLFSQRLFDAQFIVTARRGREWMPNPASGLLPYQMLWLLASSPAQYEKLGTDWDKLAAPPSGTRPFKLTKLVPREEKP